jgi:hypothetical protein
MTLNALSHLPTTVVGEKAVAAYLRPKRLLVNLIVGDQDSEKESKMSRRWFRNS